MRAVQTSPVVRWIFISIIVVIGALVLGIGSWFVLRPLENYRSLIIEEVKKATGAEKVTIGHLAWAVSPLSLAVGAKADKLEIQRAPGLAHLEVHSLAAHVQPFKLFFGKLPIKIVVHGGEAVIAPAPDGTPPKASAAASAAGQSNFDLGKYVRADLEVSNFAITADPALAGSPGADSTLRVSDVSIQSTVAGFPGNFDLEIEGRAEVDLKQGNTVASGPFRFSVEGYFQTEAEKIVGVKLSQMDLNLDKTILGSRGALEKTDSMNCRLRSKGQAILSSDGSVKQVQFDGATLDFDTTSLGFSAQYDTGAEEVSVRWAMPKTEVKNFRIPMAIWRHAPVSGILETTGQLLLQKNQLRTGNWRVALTQVRIDTANFSEVLDPSSKGTVSFSFVSEGVVDQGRISSPRTEFQLDGTEAQIEYGRGRLIKPAGHQFVALVKAQIQNERLDLSELTLVLHTFTAKGRGALDGFSSWMQGGPAQLKFDLATNRVDLSQWTGYTAAMRKPPPVEGFVEMVGSVEGEVGGKDVGWSKLNWRIDRFNLSNLRGGLDEESSLRLGLVKGDWVLSGPFTMSFLLSGRGTGSMVERASLSSHVDLTPLAFKYKDEIRKSEGVPFMLDLSAQQSKNRLTIQKGNLRFHELDLGFQGQILQGSRKGFIDLSMARPIRLSDWKQFFLKTPKIPLEGTVQWRGRVGFAGSNTFEAKLDLAKLAVEGELLMKGLGGRISGFRNPLRNGNGKILLQPEGLVVPALSFEMGGAKASLAGSLAPRGPGKGAVTLSRYLGAKGWEGSLQIALSRLFTEDFASSEAAPVPGSTTNLAPGGPTLGEQLRDLVTMPVLRESRFKVGLQVAQGRIADVAFSDLNARTLWSEGLFNLQPFGIKVFGGSVSGSAVFDATHLYTRKEPPQISLSVKTESVDVGEVLKVYKPPLAAVAGGAVSGNLTLAMQGFEVDEWMKSARGRLSGEIRKGHFDTLSTLRDSLDGFALRSEAKDYLLKNYQKEQCLQKNFDGNVDVQIAQGRLTMEKGDLRFATGSGVRLKGEIESDLKVALRGDFLASAACISGEARTCLAGSDGRATIPFKITGTATEPKPEMDYAGLGKKVLMCAASQVRAQADAEVRKRLEDAKGGVEQKAKEKLKDLFKRGG